jgi:hypothetical protein
MNSYEIVTPVKIGVQMFCNYYNILDSGFQVRPHLESIAWQPPMCCLTCKNIFKLFWNMPPTLRVLHEGMVASLIIQYEQDTLPNHRPPQISTNAGDEETGLRKQGFLRVVRIACCLKAEFGLLMMELGDSTHASVDWHFSEAHDFVRMICNTLVNKKGIFHGRDK